jgi:hypothetical protein
MKEELEDLIAQCRELREEYESETLHQVYDWCIELASEELRRL